MSETRRLRDTLAALLVVTTVASVAGCAADSAADHVDLPAKNRSQWTLPLDRYGERAVDRSQVAMQLLAQKCIEAKGYPWAVDTSELQAGPGESWNAAGRKLFNEKLAAKYGYSNSDFADVTVAEQQGAIDADLANNATAAKASAVTEPCLSRAQRKLGWDGDVDKGPYWLATQLGLAASADARRTSAVRNATKRWRACAQKIGLPDLPDDPYSMPGPTISALRPWEDRPTPAADSLKVPAEERRVAVADAKCRESSGWAKASYDAEWNAEAKAVREHADELERFRLQAQELDRRAEAVIAANAPSAG